LHFINWVTFNHPPGNLHRLNYHSNPQSAPPIREEIIKTRDEIQLRHVVENKSFLFFKRLFDVLFSTLFIVCVLSWLIPIASILIVIESRGPIFFRQRRIGKNGRHFYCLKFRTMKLNDQADEKQAEENDDRITRVGNFLRKTNVDEFPQFLNVFIGDMSIIGPRPHMITDCVRFSFVIPAYNFRSLMRPGITGLAQVKGYHGQTPDYESIFARYHWDAEYVRKATLGLDLKILSLTMFECIGNFALLCVRFCKKN
jgi:lipopolysaccharide/colanic/teichoic acid biosynthesis glycosyltransferase